MTDEFASLSLRNESKGPSPKRLKRNVSVPEKARANPQKKTTSVGKFEDKTKANPHQNTTPVGKPGGARGPPPPLPQQKPQRRQKTPIQLRIREAAIAKARARGEVIR